MPRRSQRLADASEPNVEESEPIPPRKRRQATRQSPRGIAGFTSLAERIVNRKENVVFITGAGLSVASGVRPFRTTGSGKKPSSQRQRRLDGTHLPPMAGLWDEVIWTTATRSCFRKDPLRWYNEFWIPNFLLLDSSNGEVLRPTPNPGHFALNELLKTFPNITQITQNIDGLQPPSEKIIEAHGRIGLYKCLPESDSDSSDDDEDDSDRPVQLGSRRKARALQTQAAAIASSGSKRKKKAGCPFRYMDSLEEKDLLPPSSRDAIQKHQKIPESPRCSACQNYVLPQALLFDEGYHSHSFYQFEKAEEWIFSADVLAFVGTSFAVQLTQTALQYARDKHLPVYNFNISDFLVATHRLDATNIVGPAAVTLPQLLATCRSLQDVLPVAPPASNQNNMNDPTRSTDPAPLSSPVSGTTARGHETMEAKESMVAGLRKSPRRVKSTAAG